MTAIASASRACRTRTGSNGRPIASYSGVFQPAPIATSRRPPDRTSSVARSWARTAGWRRSLLWTKALIRSVGERGDGREVRHRRELPDEVVRQDERRDAEVLRGPGPLAELAGARDVERVGEEGEGPRHRVRPGRSAPAATR